ncbi:hypothetical protein Btru_032079 [Bulinus truncatus]|nr:hypothetical protein Btru_032079 [Bulinus truncatus]
MNTTFSLLFISLANITCSNSKDIQSEQAFSSLGDICLHDLYPLIPLEGLDKIIKRCLKVEEHSDCILAKRNYSDVDIFDPPYPSFQRRFPSVYDMKRGGFLFCLEVLPEILETFELDDVKVKQCESQIQYDICYNWQTENVFRNIARANTTSWARLVDELSCNFSIHYFMCLRSQFQKCANNDFPMFYFEMAQLGSHCLLEHETFIPAVVVKSCWFLFENKNKGSVQLTTTVWLILSLILWTGLN